MPLHFQDFGNSGGLLAHLKEKCDDFERAEIPRQPLVIKDAAHPPLAVGLILHMVGGKRTFLSTLDAERLLNDGMLNRMGVPIEFTRATVSR